MRRILAERLSPLAAICEAARQRVMATEVTKIEMPYTHTRESFLSFFPELRDAVVGDPSYGKMQNFAKEWLTNMLDYNVPKGKLVRGMTVFNVVSAIKGHTEVAEADIRNANILGWCIEWLQAFFLVADDIMDGSITRRGQPCWYKQSEVGLIAFNDSIIIESTIYRILKQIFSKQPYYAQLLDLFHDCTARTAYGQMLDLITTPTDKVDLTRYTLENYTDIATYKTAHYSFYLPVACGLIVAGIEESHAFKVAEEILIPMGIYFQIQDDYLDCYADPEVLGKVGTDIQDNKCSWLVCQALNRASPEQKALLMESYGVDDAEKIDHVKALYRELKLEEVYLAYEHESYTQLTAAIEEQTVLPKGVFASLLAKIYKRVK